MVIGLASVIIGTSLFQKKIDVSFVRVTYQRRDWFCDLQSLRGHCTSTWALHPQILKLITAALFLIILVLGMERKRKVNIHA